MHGGRCADGRSNCTAGLAERGAAVQRREEWREERPWVPRSVWGEQGRGGSASCGRKRSTALFCIILSHGLSHTLKVSSFPPPPQPPQPYAPCRAAFLTAWPPTYCRSDRFPWCLPFGGWRFGWVRREGAQQVVVRDFRAKRLRSLTAPRR